MSEKSPDGWRDVLLARLQDAMWGYGGNNGVVGTSKSHESRISKLEQFQRDLEVFKEYARWMILTAAGGVMFLLTDPAAKIVAKVMSVVK